MSKTPLCPNCKGAHADGMEIKFDWIVHKYKVREPENPWLDFQHDDDRGDSTSVWTCSNCGNEWPVLDEDGWDLCDDPPTYIGEEDADHE